MRSPREIIFRLRQESWNLSRFVRPPAFNAGADIDGLRWRDPAAAASMVDVSGCSACVVELAEKILGHTFPLLGFEIQTGPAIEWRHDYVHGRDSPLAYFRRIKYLDFSRTGDHKIVWELNRHQHLVILAQAYAVTSRQDFLTEIWAELESWWEANPFQRGINWCSALEVAFRAVSWIWVYHLTASVMPPRIRRRFLESLFQHGCYIEHNLSLYFSPNTHLLGEAVVLHAMGVLFPCFPRSRHWSRRCGEIVEEQMQLQVRSDGSHFEQSSYYHLYALDMFLFHAMLAEVNDGFRDKLRLMAGYLASITRPDGSLPLMGDDDGGRFLHPYGARTGFARATMERCGKLIGVPSIGADRRISTLFPDCGNAVVRSEEFQAIFRAGGFGPGSAGHTHCDALSVVASLDNQELLIDPGTYTYVSDAKWRNWFRGAGAHNTVRIDRADQAIPAGPFRWLSKPEVRVLDWHTTGRFDYIDATCRYTYCKITHRRRMLLVKEGQFVVILDQILGESGEHVIEQFWHVGSDCVPCGAANFQVGSRAQLVFGEGTPVELTRGGEHGWRSEAFGKKTETPVIRVFHQSSLPVELWCALDYSGSDSAVLSRAGASRCTYSSGKDRFQIEFGDSGYLCNLG